MMPETDTITPVTFSLNWADWSVARRHSQAGQGDSCGATSDANGEASSELKNRPRRQHGVRRSCAFWSSEYWEGAT